MGLQIRSDSTCRVVDKLVRGVLGLPWRRHPLPTPLLLLSQQAAVPTCYTSRKRNGATATIIGGETAGDVVTSPACLPASFPSPFACMHPYAKSMLLCFPYLCMHGWMMDPSNRPDRNEATVLTMNGPITSLTMDGPIEQTGIIRSNSLTPLDLEEENGANK